MRTASQPEAQPDFQPAEELIAATGADIRFGGDRAYYARPLPNGSFPHHTGGDFIVLPPKATFDPPGAFYETAIHELAHFSEPRTGWDHDKQGYALGELAAEIASCYVSAELGIPQGEDLGNHAAYLRSWLEALKNDRNYIFKAARQASKVTDYLLGFVKKPEPEAVGAAHERNHRHLPQGPNRAGRTASPSFPSCRATSSGISAPPISMSASTAPPTTTAVSPRAIPPRPLTTKTSTRSWNGGDTT